MGFGAISSIAGMGLGAYGGAQNSRDAYIHQEEYRAALGRYLNRQKGFNNQLTGQLDTISHSRGDALTNLLAGMASPDRYAAAGNAADAASGNIRAALSRTEIPGLFNNYTNSRSGVAQTTIRRQDEKTGNRLGSAIDYAAMGRGVQGLQQYDRNLMNNLGTQYTTYGRQAGEAQADTDLRQAELNRLWQALSVRYGGPAPQTGNNAMLLGQALQLTGQYGSSVEANRPAQPDYSSYASAGSDTSNGVGGYNTTSNGDT